MKPVISLIVAAAADGAIGHKNRMLWHLPDDFRWFKKHTLGHPMVMGRKTMESIGRPLPGRPNLVVSRNAQEHRDGYTFFDSLESALASASASDETEVFVIGGGTLYQQALPLAGRIYFTRVDARFPEATVHFHLPEQGWHCIFSEAHPADERHAFPFQLEIWEPQQH